MDNWEDVLNLLDEFERQKQQELPKVLEDYLAYVARTGDPVFPWSRVRSLIRFKLMRVLTDFFETCPLDLPQCPNVEAFDYETMKANILARFDTFTGAPFTIQRLCELITNPRKEYNRVDKFMRAVEKNILVVSTIEPGHPVAVMDNQEPSTSSGHREYYRNILAETYRRSGMCTNVCLGEDNIHEELPSDSERAQGNLDYECFKHRSQTVTSGRHRNVSPGEDNIHGQLSSDFEGAQGNLESECFKRPSQTVTSRRPIYTQRMFNGVMDNSGSEPSDLSNDEGISNSSSSMSHDLPVPHECAHSERQRNVVIPGHGVTSEESEIDVESEQPSLRVCANVEISDTDVRKADEMQLESVENTIKDVSNENVTSGNSLNEKTSTEMVKKNDDLTSKCDDQSSSSCGDAGVKCDEEISVQCDESMTVKCDDDGMDNVEIVGLEVKVNDCESVETADVDRGSDSEEQFIYVPPEDQRVGENIILEEDKNTPSDTGNTVILPDIGSHTNASPVDSAVTVDAVTSNTSSRDRSDANKDEPVEEDAISLRDAGCPQEQANRVEAEDLGEESSKTSKNTESATLEPDNESVHPLDSVKTDPNGVNLQEVEKIQEN